MNYCRFEKNAHHETVDYPFGTLYICTVFLIFCLKITTKLGSLQLQMLLKSYSPVAFEILFSACLVTG